MTGRFGAPANQALSDWMDERGAENPMRGVDWLAYDRSALPADVRAQWERAMEAFFKTLTKADIAGEGRRRGVNATCANLPIDVLADTHLAAREFLQEQRSGAKTVRAPRRYVRDIAPQSPARRAPPAETRKDAAIAGPLAGVRVLDFSWALVGSFTAKTLGDFGAQIIKVESANRPCLSRLDVQTSVSRRGNFDDKPWFAHMNTSKLGMRLNLKTPGARDIAARLVDWADIILENFSPGTMKSLGLDYETLSARKPELIMVSGSVYGQTGPLAQEWGVDGTGAALSGRLALTGWPDRMPIGPSGVPYGDVVLPPIMAGAAIAALHARRATGLGRHIDASMYEICVQQMSAALTGAQLGAAPQRNGNRDARSVHQGVYPTRGDDRWIAIAILDEAMRRRFLNVSNLDWPAPAPDAADVLDARIAAWTAHADAPALMDLLQKNGVAAGIVQDARDLVSDPQLVARGFLVDLDHPILGRFAHQATPIALSRAARPMFAAPKLGEHTEFVCTQLLGMSRAEFDACAAADVFV
jgi:crotonobetainyl-CoA:carnitine CoA-transferase CaiB-like acyl-CoA transferase